MLIKSSKRHFAHNINSKLVFLVYDVTNRTSFERLEHWIVEIETYCTKSDAIRMLVGNKIDRPGREVSFDEGMEFARRHKMLFIEASAKTKEGVETAFEELIEKVRRLPIYLPYAIAIFSVIQTPGLWESRSGGGVHLTSHSDEDHGAWCNC